MIETILKALNEKERLLKKDGDIKAAIYLTKEQIETIKLSLKIAKAIDDTLTAQ